MQKIDFFHQKLGGKLAVCYLKLPIFWTFGSKGDLTPWSPFGYGPEDIGHLIF